MSNQSWTNKNIGRSIVFGKCNIYVNTGNAGEYDKWHQVDFKTMTLRPEAKTIPAVGGSGYNYRTPFSSLTYASVEGRAWNFSESKNGNCYSPYGLSGGIADGKYINGKYPNGDAIGDTVRYVPGPSIFYKGFGNIYHSTEVDPSLQGVSHIGNTVYTASRFPLKGVKSSNFSTPPSATVRIRTFYDRFYKSTTGSYKDWTNSSFSSSVEPSKRTQLYASRDFVDSTKSSKIIVVRPAYFNGSTTNLVVELCNVPANSTALNFAPTTTIDLGVSSVSVSDVQDPISVCISEDFDRIRLVYPELISTTQWIYRVFDVNLSSGSYTNTAYTIGYQIVPTPPTAPSMLCSGIIWLDFDEVIFGVLDATSIRIVKGAETLLTTDLPSGMDNGAGQFGILSSTYHLELPIHANYGGRLCLNLGKKKSVGYFLYTIIGRFGDTFTWLDDGAGAKPASYRLVCGDF